jgi:hypothetical protein
MLELEKGGQSESQVARALVPTKPNEMETFSEIWLSKKETSAER